MSSERWTYQTTPDYENSVWVSPRQWRWGDVRDAHRWAIGNYCVSWQVNRRKDWLTWPPIWHRSGSSFSVTVGKLFVATHWRWWNGSEWRHGSRRLHRRVRGGRR